MKKGDTEFEQCWLYFLKNAIEYTKIRSKWYLISREERQATDESRTNTYNQVIMALKIVLRYLSSEGADSSWFDEIESDRKKIGDFVKYINYIYAVNGRLASFYDLLFLLVIEATKELISCQAHGYPNISYFKKGTDLVDLYCDIEICKFKNSIKSSF